MASRACGVGRRRWGHAAHSRNAKGGHSGRHTSCDTSVPQREVSHVPSAADMVNMHELGKNFVEKVIDVREEKVSSETEAGTAGHLEFQCRIRGWQKETRVLTRATLLQRSNAGLRIRLAS